MRPKFRVVRIWSGNPAADAACAILDFGRKKEPAFRGSACRDYLALLVRQIEEDKAKATGGSIYTWEKACFALRRCIELSPNRLGPTAMRFLAASERHVMPHLAVALARLVDSAYETRVLERFATDLAHSPLLVGEVRVAASLDLPANILLADLARLISARAFRDDKRTVDIVCRIAPPYAAFAETGLRQAAERVRQAPTLSNCSYASDKAFTLAESAVIARLVRVALDRDETWLPPVLDELFRKVSLAPTAAKTTPSQSVALALGHAIEAFPTPEAATTLRKVVGVVRHAGVKKRLQRNLRGAERGLAGRPEIALRLPPDQPLSKPQLTTLARSLEAGFALGMALDYEDWRARLAERPQAKALTASLVWRFLDSGTGLRHRRAVGRRQRPPRAPGYRLRTGTSRWLLACRVTLWHPSDATAAERDAWLRPPDRLADQAAVQAGVSRALRRTAR